MAVTLSRFAFSLTAAKPILPAPIGGTFIRCLSSGEEFDVSIDGSPKVPLSQGRAIAPKNPDGTPQHFSSLEFTRQSGASVDPNEIVIVVGNLDYIDDTLNAIGTLSISAGQTIRQTPASAIVAVADKAPVQTGGATATKLADANPARRCITVDNTGTVPLRVAGDEADAIAGIGFYIPVGSSKELYNTSEIWAAGVGGAGACAVTEEEF